MLLLALFASSVGRYFSAMKSIRSTKCFAMGERRSPMLSIKEWTDRALFRHGWCRAKGRGIAKNPHQIIGASIGFRGARPIPVLRGNDRQSPQKLTDAFIIHERRIVCYFANKTSVFRCIERSLLIEESRQDVLYETLQ